MQLNIDATCNCVEKINEENEVLNLFRLYHCPKCRKKYDEIVKVKTDEIFNIAELEQLQLLVLELLHRKQQYKQQIMTLPKVDIKFYFL